MAANVARPRGAHLVGSVPLGSAEEVFRTASSILGDRLRRIPDGETGVRTNWIRWQVGVLQQHPAFEAIPPDPRAYAPRPRFKLRPDVTAQTLTFDDLGYADAARASYAAFVRLQGEGAVPAHCRFQVSLPTPLAPVVAFVVPEEQLAVLPAYTRRLLAEADAIAAAIPHDQLAVQWDVAVEVAVLEGIAGYSSAPFDDPQATILGQLVGLGTHIPSAVELGYHLCYGDAGHRHFKEPQDTRLLVELANGIAAGVARPLTWFHLPVPRTRTDAAYFAPLRDLRLPPATELYLGLVHHTDGVEGTQRRVAAAQQVVPHFGVATECGLGRRPAETIPALLRIHAAVSDPITSLSP